MDLYNSISASELNRQNFAFIEVECMGHTLNITLARERKKNALHPKMVHEIAYAMQFAHDSYEIWMIVLKAKGNVFCAGADLKAMAGIVEPHESTIPVPHQEILIGDLFNKVHKPVITQVTGDVYAGGFFFLAGSHIVVAQNGLTFGLPEVKRGLFPFQVMAALLRVMPARKVLDWCIRGYNLSVEKALEYGLVTEIVASGEIDSRMSEIIAEIEENSPSAIRLGLEAFDHIRPGAEEHQYLNDMLKKTIMTSDGQEGLGAFRERRKPIWTGM